MKLTVIGLGYIGLPTAAILASKGLYVNGVDISEEIVCKINQGEIHIVEPHLDRLVKETTSQGHLTAQNTVTQSDVYIVAVPTPFKKNRKPDVSYVEAAIRSLAASLKKDDLIIIESTCPVGTTEKISLMLSKLRPELSFPDLKQEAMPDVSIVYCPERVLPGNIIQELASNDRIIGGMTEHCASKAYDVYKTFVEGECIFTDCRTAELCKLAENSFRDVNIAYANELSIISDELGINVRDLIKLANKHPRVNILQPGAGVGGHCIAVDPWFIVHSSPENSRLIKTAREINDYKPKYVIDKVIEQISKLKKPTSELIISTFGLSFKPDIDDLRESPALEISLSLNKLGFKKHYVVEPNIEILPKKIFNNSSELIDADTALEKADIHVFLVSHSDFKKIKDADLKDKLSVDITGIFDS